MVGEVKNPGERRMQILQTLAAMLQEPQPEKITTAALATRHRGRVLTSLLFAHL